jgi:hypothetical protein
MRQDCGGGFCAGGALPYAARRRQTVVDAAVMPCVALLARNGICEKVRVHELFFA